ncbi:CPBP family intramembrane glutamic endopeptidase [Isoptericola chiayiensis]|uniref:CPBP family intramembrane glutamic endopeptidase n=1 Tax=Isoptericola chiayiensis TaxID=579446 RepID=UPI0015518E73|nr:CPBP family intramembrane glutamic endopeptidase [Isoptericola chiayiensis]NOW00424.1 hypothetical protein [Isoptericola chiayiensis]
MAAQLRIDRTGLTPVPRRWMRRTRWLAWAAIVLLYAAGWGESTVAALHVLAGAEPARVELGPQTVQAQALQLAFDGIFVLIALGVLLAFRRWPRPSTPAEPATWRARWRTFFVASVAVGVGFVLMGLAAKFTENLIAYPYPDVEGVAAAVLRGAASAMAGPMEETALLGVVVVALRRAGYSWIIVCITAACVRVPFHLYYGWEALLVSVWAVLLVALYRRTGTLAPIVAEHATWNLLTTPQIAEVGNILKITAIAVGARIAITAITPRTRRSDNGSR